MQSLDMRPRNDRSERGQFILTGSVTPRDDASRHSGAGRFGVIRMRPMSLFESGHSTGNVSLAALNARRDPDRQGGRIVFNDLLKRIVIGGWPGLINADEDFARDWLSDYLKQVIEVDIPSMGHRRNPRKLERLLASLARGVGQALKLSELAKDVGAAPVRYFVDPSLGPAALNIGTAELRADLDATGFHFEALAVRDLRIYAQPLRGNVDSWRDANGNEVDAVVSLGSGYAGRRPDGVHVIPITTLGP